MKVTLREYIATACLQGIMSTGVYDFQKNMTIFLSPDAAAERAVLGADALIKALKKEIPNDK